MVYFIFNQLIKSRLQKQSVAFSLHNKLVAVAGKSWWTTLRLIKYSSHTIQTVCLDLSSLIRNGWISLYWYSVIFLCANNHVFPTVDNCALRTTKTRNQKLNENWNYGISIAWVLHHLHRFYSICIRNTRLRHSKTYGLLYL